MKSLNYILCFFVLTPTIAFAGPEDRDAYQTCFVLNNEGQQVPASVPESLCLDAVYLKPGQPEVTVYSYSNQEMFSNMALKKVDATATGLSFEAEKVIHGFSEGTCKSSEMTTLTMAGPANSVGIANMYELQLAATHAKTEDSCHSEPTTLQFKYRRQ